MTTPRDAPTAFALRQAANRLSDATSGDYDRLYDDLIQRASRYMREGGLGDDHPLQLALMHDEQGRCPCDEDLFAVEEALRAMARGDVVTERRAAA